MRQKRAGHWAEAEQRIEKTEIRQNSEGKEAKEPKDQHGQSVTVFIVTGQQKPASARNQS